MNYEVKRNSNNPLSTIVYVGESTSALNLSLYGYPFETTPRLSKLIEKNKKFVKFDRVYASHTHTVDALWSAFSLCINQPKEDCSLIHNHQKNNLSIVDVLNKTEIKTFYLVPKDLMAVTIMQLSWFLILKIKFILGT